jgi:hypothetical protein
VVALLAASALPACGQVESRPCTQADLHRPTLVAMPAPVAVTRARRLNGDRLDPLPSGFRPTVPAQAAWRRLVASRQTYGGGHDELLLGRFTGRGFAGVPAWVLFTSGLAQRLSVPAGVKPGDPACVTVDVLIVVNAGAGAFFYASTMT